MNIWWNSYVFYHTVGGDSTTLPSDITNVLDSWLLSRLATLTNNVTSAMDRYDIPSAARHLMDFVSDLSNWYIRLSRTRLRDNSASRAVLGYTLRTYSLLMAPFAPFMAERIYQALGGEDSVHLEAWPEHTGSTYDGDLETLMDTVQMIVEKGHAKRKALGQRLRQPLPYLIYPKEINLTPELKDLVLQELNVKELKTSKLAVPVHSHVAREFDPSIDDWDVQLGTTLTPALIAEGEARDLIRLIQGARKKLGVQPSAKVRVELPTWPKEWETEIMQKVGATKLEFGPTLQVYAET